MIDQYTAHMIARAEHDLMKQSLASIQEGRCCSIATRQPKWLSKHISRLLRGSRIGPVLPLYQRKMHTSAETERMSMGGRELI